MHHGQSRGVAPRRLFPMHAMLLPMHMPGDRWMCQFHRGLVSIRARVIFIDSKITIRLLARASRHERASHFPRSDKSTANTDIADAESAMNEPTTECCYSTWIFFAACCREKIAELRSINLLNTIYIYMYAIKFLLILSMVLNNVKKQHISSQKIIVN